MDALEVGRRFARSLAGQDWDAVVGTLDPDVTFMAMTPRRFWESPAAPEGVSDVLQRWFDDSDEIQELEDLHVERVAERYWLRYRLRVRNGDGTHLVEQQAYYDVVEHGAIRRMHVMCAGYQPLRDRPTLSQ